MMIQPKKSLVDRQQKWSLYDGVMLLYLLSGGALMPLIIGEILVAGGIVGAMNEQTMPSWMYGYVVMTTYMSALALFFAWIPAILVCVVFWNRLPATVPALAILVFTSSLFLMSNSKNANTVMNVSAVIYTFTAFGVGLQWAIRRLRAGAMWNFKFGVSRTD